MQFGMKYFRRLTIPEYEYYETKAENKDELSSLSLKLETTYDSPQD